MTAGATLEARGVELAYDEHGDGHAVVLVHGTATPRAVWREAIAELGGRCRTIVYDRRAYGESGAPEPYGGTTVGEQADDLAELIRTLGAAPALVCGHELGGLACLDLLLRHRELARGAVVVEPPMLWLVPEGADAVSELRAAVEQGAREGGAAGAVTAFLEAAAGPDALELLGGQRADAARAAPRAFAADLAAPATWAAGRRELRAIDAPVTVVSGTRSAPIRRAAAAALAELLPQGRLVEVDAGHLAHVEAASAVAAEISAACA